MMGLNICLATLTFNKNIVAYRTAGAIKTMLGFDVIDYGQEDYVFGNREKDVHIGILTCLKFFKNMQMFGAVVYRERVIFLKGEVISIRLLSLFMHRGT